MKVAFLTHDYAIALLFNVLFVASAGGFQGWCCGGCYDERAQDLVTAMSYFVPLYFSHQAAAASIGQ